MFRGRLSEVGTWCLEVASPTPMLLEDAIIMVAVLVNWLTFCFIERCQILMFVLCCLTVEAPITAQGVDDFGNGGYVNRM